MIVIVLKTLLVFNISFNEIKRLISRVNRSSYKERMVNALALGADEGRDKLR